MSGPGEPAAASPTRRRALSETAVFGAGATLFALTVHAGGAWTLVAVAGLVLAQAALVLSLGRAARPTVLLGLRPFSRRAGLLTVLGLLVGVALGAWYRWSEEVAPLPGSVGAFAPAAVLIGAAEELFYRGYVQGRLRVLGVVPAVILAAAWHAAYKSALFAWPPEGVATTPLFVAGVTLFGGLLFGGLRAASKSLWPPLAAHAAFDFVVYGALASAPWWVFG